MIVKKIIKNVAWLLMERSGKILASIFIGGILARQLGVEGYGQFQYAISVVLLFASLGLICGGEVIVPRLAQMPATVTMKIMGDAFSLRFGFAIFAYFGMMGCAFFTQGVNSQSLLIGILGLTVFFTEPFGVIIAWQQSRAQSKSTALIALCAVMVKLAFILFLYELDLRSKLLFAALWLLESILVAVGLLVIYRRQNERFFFGWSLNGIVPLFKAGLPFWFGLIAMYVFMRMDRLLLKEYKGVAELGIYSAVMQISENMTMVASAIAAVAAPLLIYNEEDERKLRKNVLKLAIGMFAVGLFGALTGTLMAPWIIKTLFGGEFAPAASMLGYSLFAATIVFVEAALNTFLLKRFGGRKILFKWTVAMLISLAVDLWAIPRWGGYGAIMGFASGYLTAVTLGCYWLFGTKAVN